MYLFKSRGRAGFCTVPLFLYAERKHKMNDNQNLTTGNVPIKLIVFALPLLAANLLQSFYSLVDMVVVGRIVGENGLAAISNAP